jgi:hypothetical protein
MAAPIVAWRKHPRMPSMRARRPGSSSMKAASSRPGLAAFRPRAAAI